VTCLRLISTTNTNFAINKRPKEEIPSDYRFKYREFLPDPEQRLRNPIREKLERMDMIARRSVINIPEFYVGSIIAVTSSDAHSANKTNRFLGICIEKKNTSLATFFTLRNCIDNQGVEIKYDLYDPTIQKIEVIRLEKRLDDDLQYLRDALPEFSTFDMNMETEIHAEGSEVPVNPLQVKLRPRPWTQKWERKPYKGIENIDALLYPNHQRKAAIASKPWEEYDLMLQYRKTIPEEEQVKIFSEIQPKLREINEENKKKMKATRRGAITKPQTLG
jgi:large subunit ribosomal protein L19